MNYSGKCLSYFFVKNTKDTNTIEGPVCRTEGDSGAEIENIYFIIMFSLSVYSSETKKTLFFSNNVLHKDHEPPCFYSSFYSSPERSNQTKYCYRALYVKARVQIKLLLTKSKDKDWKCDRLA